MICQLAQLLQWKVSGGARRGVTKAPAGLEEPLETGREAPVVPRREGGCVERQRVRGRRRLARGRRRQARECSKRACGCRLCHDRCSSSTCRLSRSCPAMLDRLRRLRVVALSFRHRRVSVDIAGRLQGGEQQKQQQRRKRGGYTSAPSSITVTHLADVDHSCHTRGRAALPCRGDSLVSDDARVGRRGGVVEARSRGAWPGWC